MSKFCNKCGKELVDGKCPNCSKEEKVTEKATEEVKLNIEDVKNTVKNLKDSPMAQKIINYYKSAVISPIKLAKDEANALTTKLNWLICLLNSVIIGLMTIILIKLNVNQIVEYVKSWERSMVGYSSLNNLEIQIPYLKILLFIVVMSIISNIIIVILEKIFFGIFCRSKGKMSKYFSTQMLLYTIFTIAYVVGIIASFISVKLYFMIFVLGLIMDIVILVQLSIDEKKTKKNILAIITPIYVVISVVAVIFVWVLGFGLVIYNYNSAPATINDADVMINQSIESSGYNFNW